MSPFTYRDLFDSLPESVLDAPVRVFLRDAGAWVEAHQVARVDAVDSQGDLAGDLPDDAWVLSTR